jgi:4-amino-4-deoxy-L-arabinose transferase-like glycosyltransferase
MQIDTSAMFASPSRPTVQWPLLAAALSLALLVRAVYLLQAAQWPSFSVPYAGLDVELYRLLAGRVAAGDLALGDEPYWFSAPYAYWLGALYALFGKSPWTAAIANVVIGVGTVGLIYSLTLRWFASRGAAAIAAFGAALYGPYIVFDTSGLKTSLGLFLTALGLRLLLRALDRPQARNWLAAGGVLALAIWLAQGLLIVLALLVLWLLSGRLGAGALGPRRARTRVTVWLLAGVVLALAPFFLRNLLIAGEPLPFTAVGGIHLYIGNHAGASGAYSGVQQVRNNAAGHFTDAKRVAEQAAGHPLSYRQASAYWRHQALQFARDDPTAALALFAQKALLALNAYEIPNNDDYRFLVQRSGLLHAALDVGWLLPLGLAGLMLGLRGAQARMPLYLLFCGLLIGLVLTLVTWRYRLPLTLALWPAAGYAIARGAYWLKEHRWLPLGGLALLVLAGLMLTRLPLVAADKQATSLRGAEIKMQAAGQELRFRRELAAGSLDRDAAMDGWIRIAQARRNQNDWEGALRVLREGESHTGRDVRLSAAQASLLRRLGDHEQAMALQRELSRHRSPTGVRVMGADGEIRTSRTRLLNAEQRPALRQAPARAAPD